MDFYQATSLIGTYYIITNILLALRKRYKADSKLARLLVAAECSLRKVEKFAEELAPFEELDGIRWVISSN